MLDRVLASVHKILGFNSQQRSPQNKTKPLTFHIPVGKLNIPDTYTTAALYNKHKLPCQKVEILIFIVIFDAPN